jgi:release factor glutamine methyltransferase
MAPPSAPPFPTQTPSAPSAAEDAAGAKAWTILDVVKWTTGRFAERGIASPRLDAELLTAHALGLPRIALYTQFDRPLQTAELGSLRALVKRRQAGEPVAYLTGRKEFWSLELVVDPRVLIPRPDTETAVEVVLDFLRPAREPEANVDAASRAAENAGAARIADIGTGSGAIALALKKELPHAEVFAVDVSPEALAVAEANAARLGLDVRFLTGDLMAPLREHAPFDVVVANLPYVPRGDLAGLAPEVRSEPKLALDGGADGLDLVRRLASGARALVRPGGLLVLEIGVGQAAATAAACATAGWGESGSKRDLDGIERVVWARANEGS